MNAPAEKALDTREETITPEVARRYLGLSKGNRNMRQRVINKYARDMIAGNWKRSGETIKFDIDMRLVDGHHRLAAVVQSDTAIKCIVVRGVPVDAMKTIDTGAPRLFADVVDMAGQKNSTVVAAACRWWAKYEGGLGKIIMISHSELESVLTAHPSIHQGAQASKRHLEAKRLVPVSILAFVYARIYENDADAADLFIDSLGTGEGLKEGDAMLALRRALITNAGRRTKYPPADMLALLIKTFNYMYEGRSISIISYKQGGGEEFPKFVFDQPKKRPRQKLAQRQPVLVG